MSNQDKPKVLVSAYACEPNKGSEIGVGWNWVLEMSKNFDLWVVTRSNNKENIEEWLNNNRNYSINFLYYDLPKELRFWKKGMRGVRTYYCLWQMGVKKIIKREMKENNIQIFHHLTYGNALLPIPKLDRTKYIWGPIGGVEIIEKDFSKHYDLREKIIESIRRSVVKATFMNIFFHQRCKMADLILCKTTAMYEAIPNKYKSKAIHCTDVAVDLDYKSINQDIKDDKNINYLSIGRFDAWRGFDLLIESFAKAVEKNPNIRLSILGDGSDKERLKYLIKKLNMAEYISLDGQVSIEEYRRRMETCDVVVNSCLKEGGVTTAFDSLSYSKPLICIDTGGYTKNFCNDYAIVVPRTSRSQIICDLSRAIDYLSDDSIRNKMSLSTVNVKEDISWAKKGSEIKGLLTQVLGGYNEKAS